MQLAFGNFVLKPVLGVISEKEAAEVRGMWTAEGVLTSEEAARRVREVMFLVRVSGTGELAGVSSVYPGTLGATGQPYWHYRMFMRSPYRGVSRLPMLVLQSTYEYLRSFDVPWGEMCRGMVIVAENPAFRRNYEKTRRFFAKQEQPWRHFGTDARGCDIFYRDF